MAVVVKQRRPHLPLLFGFGFALVGFAFWGSNHVMNWGKYKQIFNPCKCIKVVICMKLEVPYNNQLQSKHPDIRKMS